MRVGLNATCYNQRPSGARQRFLALYGSLIRQRPDIEFVIYDPSDCAVSSAFSEAPNVRAVRTPVPSRGRIRKTWSAWGYWPRQLRADRLDLFEQFNLPLVVAPDCPTILTVHDIRDAEAASPFRPLYRMIWRSALRNASHVVTVSDTMREEILAFSPGTPVTRIYNGLDPAPFRNAQAVRQGYLLAVGHLEPRKNYGALIEAIRVLNMLDQPSRLIVVGRDGGSQAELERQIDAAKLRDRVTILADVDDEKLVSLYAGCETLVFPSLYEGFGIPLIEAMAAGRPFVTSNIPVFRELSEDRGVYFDPADPQSMADAISLVRRDARLADQLVRYGQRRIDAFAIERLAREIAALYDRLLPAAPVRHAVTDEPTIAASTDETDSSQGGIA